MFDLILSAIAFTIFVLLFISAIKLSVKINRQTKDIAELETFIQEAEQRIKDSMQVDSDLTTSISGIAS